MTESDATTRRSQRDRKPAKAFLGTYVVSSLAYCLAKSRKLGDLTSASAKTLTPKETI